MTDEYEEYEYPFLRDLPDSMTLGEVRQLLRDNMYDGIKCPACTQFVRIYNRKLNSGMARSLIRIYIKAGLDWFDLPRVCRGSSREEGKLRYWRLLEMGEERGLWRLTTKGELFVLGRIKVPSHAEIYDDRLLKLGGDPINIHEALGSKFDYDELMETPGTKKPPPI